MRGVSLKILRIFRVVFALVFFIFISAQFVDVYNDLPKWYYKYNPAWVQFTPSFLRAVSGGALASAWVFISLILLTIIFGRAYCSFLCPFGILSDILRRIALLPSRLPLVKNSAFGKKCGRLFGKMFYAPARNILRGVFLALAIFFVSMGWTALLGFIDPYSLFGKVAGGLLHTASGYAANVLSGIFYNFGIYSIEPTAGSVSIPVIAFLISLFILIGLFVASAFRGRIFCNTICPVGAFLGLLGKVSVFKMRIDDAACVKCGMCARECKAQCIDFKNKTIDASRCVDCFNCASVCRKDAIYFGIGKFGNLGRQKKTLNNLGDGNRNSDKEQKGVPGFSLNSGRRAFFSRSFGFGVAILGAARAEAKGNGMRRRKHLGKNACKDEISPFSLPGNRPDKRLTVPAGAISIDNFLEHCTGCQICVAACKAHILKPSIGEYGLAGFMQPFMDYSAGFCLDTCHDCSKICPTGAIRFVSKAEKRLIKIGTAIFDEDLCVVKRDGTDCSACGEHCPAQAIEMLPFGKKELNLYIPHVHKEVCIGCGACEYVCPVVPHKAIVVRGLAVHRPSKAFNDNMRIYKPELESAKEVPEKSTSGGDVKKGTSSSNPFPF